jgi:signal transduction histidine kinase
MTTNKQTEKLPNTGNLGKIIIAVLLTWVLCKPGVLASTTEEEAPKRILAIFAFKQALPWAYRIEENMRATLASESPFPIELNIEHADRPRYPDEIYLRKVVDFYRYKYSGQKVDLVLALGDEAAELLIEYGEELFGDIPVVLVSSEAGTLPRDLMKPNMTSLVWGWDTGSTIALIKDLLPQTKHLFIISGASNTDLSIRKNALKVAHKYENRFNIQFITDFVTSEMLEKVSKLPNDSAIFFLSVLRDVNNEYFVSRDLMHVVSEKANAPVFGIGDTYLGHGIVGGSLLSAENQGKRFANIAVRLLRDKSAKDIESMGTENRLMFDWRQLKRWSIDEKRLPPGSIVRYREVSIWEDHKGKIIGVIVIIFSQAFALILLLIQRNKRSRAEDESQRLRDDLTHVSRVLSMGEIATSLAHEINQPLTAIQSYAQAAQRFLRGDPPDIDEMGKSLHGIVAGSRRAKQVIQRIRRTLEKKPLERLPLQVKDLIHDVIMLVQRRADEKKVLLMLDLADGLPQVFGDRTQLQQVLLNLIINGFEAIGDAGDGSRELDVRASKGEPNSVMISVQDSGIGIDEEHMDLLFNAFFTTKAEGLGMGLSISKSIIENHGGRLWATQNSDQGTTFSFTVPIYMEDQR